MPAITYRALIVDDIVSIHDDFRKVLAPPVVTSAAVIDLANAIFGQGPSSPQTAPVFELDFATQGDAAVRLVQQAKTAQRPFALAFVDMRMPPGWDGLETISQIWAADPDVQIVICSAFADHSWASITARLGQSHNLLILKKPFDHIEALQHAHALASKWEITRRNRAHLIKLNDLLAQRTSPPPAAEARFSEAFNASPLAQAIVAVDPFEILEVNEALEKQLNLSAVQLRALTPETFGHGVDPTKWRQLLDTLARGELIHEHPFVFQPPAPARPRHFCASARAITVDSRPCSIWILRDVTQQIETGRKLLRAQNLEALGQRAAGIAHDFDRLLAIIHLSTAEALDSTLTPAARSSLNQVETAVASATALTRQLLFFARCQAEQPECPDPAGGL